MFSFNIEVTKNITMATLYIGKYVYNYYILSYVILDTKLMNTEFSLKFDMPWVYATTQEYLCKNTVNYPGYDILYQII